jgi:hypothetical protein
MSELISQGNIIGIFEPLDVNSLIRAKSFCDIDEVYLAPNLLMLGSNRVIVEPVLIQHLSILLDHA